MWDEQSRKAASRFAHQFGLDKNQIKLMSVIFDDLREVPSQVSVAARMSTLGVKPSNSDMNDARREPGVIMSELLLNDEEYARYAVLTRNFRRRTSGEVSSWGIYAAKTAVVTAIIMGKEDQAKEICHSDILDYGSPGSSDWRRVKYQALSDLMDYLNDPSDLPLSWWAKLTGATFGHAQND